MIILTRILVAAVGLLFAFMAAGFLLSTETEASKIGLTTLSAQGFATVRADIGGFFAFCAGLSLYGAATKSIRVLWPVALLVTLALAGRLLSLVLTGPGDMFHVPIIAEVIIIVILLWAHKTWSASAPKFGISR
ncbi:hypothetical protein ACR9YC_10015 [Parasphingorhabdus sp. DH2-15]|uniref:hypothetical protein n=1 Tax=Parasphingorhabdus sp. DH2-15 TaxID=3444112 RepID=UPI003F6877B1